MILQSKKTFQISVITLFACISIHTYGQNRDWRIYRPSDQRQTAKADSQVVSTRMQPVGVINIIADSRIAKLNEKKKKRPTKMDGYRVQLFFGDRSKAQNLRGEFIRQYPNTTAYISYLAPNFRVRVGDFRTRLASEKFRHKINSDFPRSYIVRDKIELPPLQVDTMMTNINE